MRRAYRQWLFVIAVVAVLLLAFRRDYRTESGEDAVAHPRRTWTLPAVHADDVAAVDEDANDDDDDDVQAPRVSVAPNPLEEKALSASGPPTPKIAFLFLAHNTSHLDALEGAWRAFLTDNHTADGRYNVYVHTAPGVRFARDSLFATREVAGPIATSWGSPTLVRAELKLLQAALDDDPANTQFVLLSSTCLPARSFAFIYDFFFTHNAGVSFLEANQHGFSGFQRRFRKNTIGVTLDSFVKGSQWWALHRSHAREFFSSDARTAWIDTFLATFDLIPDEHFFPNFMRTFNLTAPATHRPYSLTYTNWYYEGHSSTIDHPQEFCCNATRYEALMKRIPRSRFYFGYHRCRPHMCLLFTRKWLECPPDGFVDLLHRHSTWDEPIDNRPFRLD